MLPMRGISLKYPEKDIITYVALNVRSGRKKMIDKKPFPFDLH